LLRKFFAILLLSIHVFALGGYRLVLNYFEKKADKLLVQKIDNNHYNEADLITIKIPLNLPYTVDRAEFERCDGTLNINDTFYNYVKRKLSNDTLILQCIANNKKTKLNKENNQYVKEICSEQTSSSHGKTTNSLLKSIFFEYNYKACGNLTVSFFIKASDYISVNDNSLYSCFIPLHTQPPKMRVV
jgi:hypothetical protein